MYDELFVPGVSISPVVKSIFEADSGDGSYRHSSEAIQVCVRNNMLVTICWYRNLRDPDYHLVLKDSRLQFMLSR